MDRDPQYYLFLGLVIAAVFARAPMALIVIAAIDGQSTSRARYTMLGAAMAIAIAVDGTLLYNYSLSEIFGLVRHFTPDFQWPLVMSLGCSETILAIPLAIWRIRRTPNKIAYKYWSRERMILEDGEYVPFSY